MSKFIEEGFLSSNSDNLCKQYHANYKEWFELFESLNRYCWSIAGKLIFHKDNKQEYLSCGLFLRMLSTFNGIYLLMERGMLCETKVLSRTLIEELFSLCAIAKNKEIANAFYQQNIILKYEALKKLVESSPNGVLADGKEHGKRLSELKNMVGKTKIKKLSVKDLAEKAGLHEYYASAYPYLSWASHANILEIGQLLNGNSDDSVEGVSLSPQILELPRYFLAGMECMIVALRSMNDLFNLQENNKIEEYVSSYSELHRKSESNDSSEQ